MNATINFDAIRHLFGKLSPLQVRGIESLIEEWNKRKNPDLRQLAYILATVFHETATAMQPIKERGGDEYLKAKPYYPYYGRDLLQTTWIINYERVKRFTGIDVVANPALITAVAVSVAIEFMIKGYYTGKKLLDYFSDTTEDWVHARRIINGLDKADLIAGYGKTFYSALSVTT